MGFWKAIGTVGLAPAFTVGVRVVFQDGRRDVIAEIRGTQQLTSAFTPSMQPIMVTSASRSGSTLLMRMLAEHPDIIVHKKFPYQTHVCSYWMHFLQVLATPADTSPESLQFWKDPKRLPSFPYFFIDPATGPIAPEHATLDRWYATIRSKNSPAWRRLLSSRSTASTPARDKARHLPSSRRRSSRQATSAG